MFFLSSEFILTKHFIKKRKEKKRKVKNKNKICLLQTIKTFKIFFNTLNLCLNFLHEELLLFKSRTIVFILNLELLSSSLLIYSQHFEYCTLRFSLGCFVVYSNF